MSEPGQTEPIEEVDTSGLMDNPNQQAVRPDGSGPADEGEGGTTRDDSEEGGLDKMTKAELIDHAEAVGIQVDDSMKKDEIRELLG